MTAARDELDLAGRAVDGDAEALTDVIRRVQDPVFRLAVRMVGRPADAEDATQEILIRVITRLASWRGEAALVTWAYRIAVNYLLNQRRTAYERHEVTFDNLGEDLSDTRALSDYEGPDAELLATEVRLGCTQAMLQCLDRMDRVVLVLSVVFDLPSDEAGWILDISAAAYRKRLERARERIRQFMTATCGLVNPDAPCRCGRRIRTALARGRVDPARPAFTGIPSATAISSGTRQMRYLHDVAAVLRSHPGYTLPRERSEAVAAIIRSGRVPLLSADPPA